MANEQDECHVIKSENFRSSRWRTVAILKIDISPHLSEKSSDFYEILYTAADFELDERHMIKNEKVALDTPISTEPISCLMSVFTPSRLQLLSKTS